MPPPQPQTPEWWLRQLHAKIISRRPKLNRLASYYDGQHALGFASEKFLEAFGGIFRAFADNFCALVCDAVEERLNVAGFRIDDDPAGDQDAWRIWQANELDAQSQMGHTEALINGEAYGVVWVSSDPSTPEITIEHPGNVAVQTHPKFRRQRQAALRLYLDDWGFEHAELFLPDNVFLYRSKTTRGDKSGLVDAARTQWVVDTTVDEAPEGEMPNPFGVVPVVPLPNRPRLQEHQSLGIAIRSEIAAVIPVQDAINKLVADMMITSEYAAYPQRYALGMEIPTDPQTGQPINPFTPNKRVWMVERDEDGNVPTFNQFQVADLSNYASAIELLVQHVATQTRTPPHYFYLTGQFPSGEALKSAEAGLIAKTRRKQRHFGEAWEEIMRLAGQIAELPQLAKAESAETIWADPETRTEAEHIDAVVKRKALEVPLEQLWEDADYTPQQIGRFQGMRMREQLAGLLVPPTTISETITG